jgi:hypothetical protein
MISLTRASAIASLLGLLSPLSFSLPQRPRAQPVSLKPVDETSSDPSLVSFRAQLIEALRRGDAAFLRRHAEPAEAVRWTGDESTVGDPLNAKLIKALELGGAFTTTRGAVNGRREFCAPYVYTVFPTIPVPTIRGDQVNNEGHPWATVRPDVPVLRQPSATSPVRGHVRDFELVTPTGDGVPRDDTPSWFEVVTQAPIRGWVRSKDIQDPAGIHVCLYGSAGAWAISEIDANLPSSPIK